MAHPEQQHWCQSVKDAMPHFFTGLRVLDVGALDVNGNNRGLFTECEYIGLDVGPGPNVDEVCPGHEFDQPDHSFDVVLSTEALEHDPHWPLTVNKMYRLVKPGGLMFFTCAAPGRAEHGTRRCSPEASPLTTRIDEWADYYRNLSEEDIRSVLPVEEWFEKFEFVTDPGPHDLRFWGVKRSS